MHPPNTGALHPRSGKIVQRLIRDLEAITGLTLYLDEETMSLRFDRSAEVTGGSATARSLLIGLIYDPRKIPVGVNHGFETRTGGMFGDNGISLDFNQIGNFIAGTKGVDNRTLGWGMTFLHEAMHTAVGGSYRDPFLYGLNIGMPDIIGNAIRRELGPEWGQRVTYRYFTLPGDPASAYIPFTTQSYFMLLDNKEPKSGYVKFRFATGEHD